MQPIRRKIVENQEAATQEHLMRLRTISRGIVGSEATVRPQEINKHPQYCTFRLSVGGGLVAYFEGGGSKWGSRK